MKFVFDLDGVLRDFWIILGERYGIPYPQYWDWKHEGKNIFDWMEHDGYDALISASPTPYLDVVRELILLPEIWTSQPLKWRIATRMWLEKHIGECILLYLNTKDKEQWLYKDSDIILFEDNPNFVNYERIVLIDRPYNQDVKDVKRIKTADEMKEIIKRGKI